VKVKMKLEGMSDLQEQLENLSQGLAAKTLAKATRKAFAPVLTTAKAYVPVDTGLLRDSIVQRVVKPKDPNATWAATGLKVTAAKGGRKSDLKGFRGSALKAAKRLSASWRWHFIELGTSKMAAKPFLRPALQTHADAVIDALKRDLARRIKLITRIRKVRKK
jgi:HK97 gp10 family phage protein